MTKFFLYSFLIALFAGCTRYDSTDNNMPQALYAEPLVVPLNLNEGYKINQLTGDSIGPLLNSLGRVIHTGTPFSITGQQIDMPGFAHPSVIKQDAVEKTIIEANVQPLKGNPQMVLATPQELPVVAVSENTDSIIIDKSNYLLLSHKKMDVAIKKITVHEPQPVKIQPMRYKDNALLDIQYLDMGQGLAYAYIYAMYQDKNGNLWFGTDYGLCKYDGTYLTTYTEKNGLINNKVNSITADNKGRLWIGTYGGITVFDGTCFLQFTDKDTLLKRITALTKKDSSGKIWMTLEGFGVIGYDGNSFIFYTSKHNFVEKTTPAFFMDQKGVFWFRTPQGLIRYNGKNFIYFNPGSHILDVIIAASEDSKGNTWFSSMVHGIVKYDGKYFTHYTKDNGLSDNTIFSLMIDRNDHIWIGTRYKGLNKFDGKNFTTYNSAYGLSEDKISCTIEDQQRNIWIGTMGGGVCKLNDDGFVEKIPLSKLNNSRARPIIKDSSGRLWFGTEGAGLFSYDGTSLFKNIDWGINNLHGFRSALIDKKSNLWFGEHEGSGFYKYDYKTFLYYQSSNPTINLSLFEDDKSVIWIGTTGEGVTALNGNTGINYKEASGFPSNRVFVTKQDKKGNLWFGTEGGGLVKFDGNRITVFSEKQGLFCKSITSIEEDEKGNLWLGTLGAGLCKFDGNSFIYYTEKQGLAFNAIWSLKRDANGQIWVGTDNGLSALIPFGDSKGENNSSYKVYSFGLQDGLKATDFNLNSVCIDNANVIWWGTGKALITRNLNMPFIPDTPKSLKISHIEMNGQFMDFHNLPGNIKNKVTYSITKPFLNYPLNLTLPYDQNHLTFYFSAIDWKAPQKIKYTYRLLGLDNIWSKPSSDARAEFRNLSHGSYELQIKAIGQSQVWTTALSYKFTILPAWWQTWWFKFLVVLLSMALAYLITRQIYLARLRKQKALLEKQLAVQMERQRISSEMHDDIGAGLSGVRLLTEMTKNKLKETNATGDIDKIYESVGEISAKMKEVIWSLNTENDSLSSLIAYLQKQSRQLMEHYPGKFTITILDEIPEVKISGEVRRHIYLSVKEALHNTIKHSGADKVEMKIHCKGELQISITDNGKGLNTDENSATGNGLKNMKKRMKQINGIFSIKKDKGLTITFTIPYNSAI